MTGFSSQTVTIDLKSGGTVTLYIELKSLNSRFFEVTSKLFGSLSQLEVPMTSLLKEKLIRGRVYAVVRVLGDGDLQDAVVPSMKVIESYLTASKEIKEKFSVSGELEISDIIKLAHVFSFEKATIDKDDEQKVLDIIRDSADQLTKVRMAEGERLLVDLKQRFELCDTHINEIEKFLEPIMKNHKEKVAQVLAKAQEGDLEAESQLSDLYATLNKIDLHEEITRFKSHLKGVAKLLDAESAEKGRRLDFMMQELAREINTITAKCSSFDIGSVAVDVKVELEKAREQIQNIV